MKFSCKRPRRVRLVYFGRTGIDLLRNYISEESIAVYLSPLVELNLWVALRMILSGRVSQVGYYHAFLRLTMPSHVITMEDNNLVFYSTRVALPECRTIAIQNGLRGSHSHTPLSNFFKDLKASTSRGYGVTVCATLGPAGSQYYIGALGDSVAQIVEIGSVRNNAIVLRSPQAPREQHRLVFISTFPNLGAHGTDPNWESHAVHYFDSVGLTNSEYYRIEGVLARMVAEIALDLGLDFCVLGKRPSWQSGERRFFQNCIGTLDWQYLPNENQASSYQTVTDSDLIITTDSTLGYELFARGLRTGFVSARMRLAGYQDVTEGTFAGLTHSEIQGPFWTDSCTRSEVNRLIHYLLTASDDEWQALTESLRSRVVRFDFQNGAFCGILSEVGISNHGPSLWQQGLIPAN